MKKVVESGLRNLSMSVWCDTVRLGEIIHWQRTGIIESWHYREQYATKKIFIDIATFDEKSLEYAILWAKFGQACPVAKEHAICTRTGCTYPNNTTENQKD